MTTLLPAFHARFGSLGENYICTNGKMSGLLALCDLLKANNTLTTLECAFLALASYGKRQQPMTALLPC